MRVPTILRLSVLVVSFSAICYGATAQAETMEEVKARTKIATAEHKRLCEQDADCKAKRDNKLLRDAQRKLRKLEAENARMGGQGPTH